MDRANLTLPNLLTLVRLFMVPCVLWALLADRAMLALGLFVLAALTDFLDGNLARFFHQRSVLGAWLDPIADKAMLLTSLITLTWLGVLPLWLAFLVGVRDGVVVLGAAAYRILTGGLEVSPSWWGKAATAVEFVLVTLALAKMALGWGAGWLFPLAVFTGALTLISGVDYVMAWSGKAYAWRRSH